MRVLVVEDHEDLAEAIGVGLRREGMAVDVTCSGADALGRATITRYDVVVLDRDLPDVHGDEVCGRLVADGIGSRVLMLTAASSVKERVDGLGLGADDYLPKPFDFSELIARIRALARRSTPALPPTLERADVTLDPNQRVAFRAGRRLALTPKEFAVLECLLAAGDRVVSAEELLDRVWDDAADPFTTTVRTTIGRLRAKLVTPAWLLRARPTARLRLTLFYSALFVLSSACLLAIPYLLVRNESTGTMTYDPTTHLYTYVAPDHEVYMPTSKGQSRAMVVQLRALAVSQHDSELHQFLVYSASALAVMAAVSVLLGWLVAGRVLRPLRTINTTARRISAHSLHQRLSLAGPDDEFKELGATLDDLLGRLAASFESQRRFVANASHELRTPLTLERTLLQVALADPHLTVDTLRVACEKVLTSGDQQERLIDALLTLASTERGLEETEPFDLAEITRQVLAHGATERAGQRGLHLDTAIVAASTLGDPRLAQRLVTNLLDNAIQHNLDHGKIVVTTGTVTDRPFLSVTNTGPVVPAAEISRLLEPFQQLGQPRTGHRNGHGLGLTIVAAIATAHHADLSVRPLPDGGLAVEVRFPAAAISADGPLGSVSGTASKSAARWSGARTVRGSEPQSSYPFRCLAMRLSRESVVPS